MTNNGQRLDIAAGFYAIAYDWTDSTNLRNTVISYRGTDTTLSTASYDEFLQSPLIKDAWNGWALGAGYAGASQGGLALSFYHSVFNAADENGNIIVDGTQGIVLGHSLGGGLAGFVASNAYTGSNLIAYGYDHMPFGVAAWAQAITEAFVDAVDSLSLDLNSVVNIMNGNPSLVDFVNASLTVSDFVIAFASAVVDHAPRFSNFYGIHTEGEVLTYVRDGLAQVLIGDIAGTVLSALQQPGLALLVQAAGLALGGGTVALEALLPAQSELSTFGAFDLFTDTVQLHSMALLTTLEYADKQWPSESGAHNTTDWQYAAADVLPAIMDEEVASGLNRQKDVTGAAEAGDQLATIIAYSAIDQGTMPFGDTGIRALFDDASDLGKTIDPLNTLAPQSLIAGRTGIGRFIAEYAGFLATNGVTQSSNPLAIDGVLHAIAATGRFAHTLELDFTSTTWSIDGTAHEVVTRDDVVTSLLNGDGNGSSILTSIDQWYSINVGVGHTIEQDIDRISIGLSGTGKLASAVGAGILMQVLSDSGNKAVSTTGTDFILGGEADDTITGGGGSDILIGGGGNDALNGSSASDYLSGGSGDDILHANGGKDSLFSASGYDILYGDGGRDILTFDGGTGVAIGGLGNDRIDPTRASAFIRVEYYTGDGFDKIVQDLEGIDVSSLQFDADGNIPDMPITKAYVDFMDLAMGEVNLVWDASITDSLSTTTGRQFDLLTGHMIIESRSGTKLVDIGEAVGTMYHNDMTTLSFHNIAGLHFIDGYFDYNEGANGGIVLI
ncbi:hypothetical protein OOT33_01855 [Sphingobium sp. DEHP117]|uniref:calcium-binding protein n=1 Tax=Sphingobium sp. DEHP117 TaxID=2993436 RepID=UPI0027D5B5BD|nr:hypothetical protein [Sphingobium sp. DEHP117]MDQ4419187.1 hypothetical protein [Sphingobium sp. DEHP117]